MRIHVVSFQVPWPANYGGVIDVFYKLKALHEAGVEIVLHTFAYNSRHDSVKLQSVADRIFFYSRKLNPLYCFSSKPFIVRSRYSDLLLERLSSVPSDEPILFEGHHTTAYVNHPALKDKIKIVRMHNIEYQYYGGLAESASNLFKKLFFRIESLKLRYDERRLSEADALITISEADTAYYKSRFSDTEVDLVTCFTESDMEESHAASDSLPISVSKPYILYHGNLSVVENLDAVKYIVNELLPRLDSHVRMVVAGLNPPESLKRQLSAMSDVTLIESPDNETMNSLVRGASINLLLTAQATGIKLKLLKTLSLSRGHCVVNSDMANDSQLRRLCHIADNIDDQVEIINALYGSYASEAALGERRDILSRFFNASEGARKIIEIAKRCKKSFVFLR